MALLLAAGPVMMAQSTTGALSGAVKDSTGAPTPGARITIVSTALFAPRVLSTDSKGEWRAPLLPPGTYKVTVDKNGFNTTGVDNVRVGLGTTGHFDFVLRPTAAATATVEVIASAVALDKTDTKSSSNFSAETLSTLPAADRSFAGAADLAPGLTVGLGGSYSIRGGATQSTQFRVNGTDVKDDYQGDLTSTTVIEDNIEDVQVILSPLNARNGRALGGAINIVTKTGNNDFAGSIRSNISRGTWGGTNPSYLPISNNVNDNLNKSYQVTFSGPILKDRIWFSLGTILQPSQHYNYTTGVAYGGSSGPVRTGNAAMDPVITAGPGGTYAWTPFETNAPYDQTYDNKYYEGKLTGAISTDHTVGFSYALNKVSLGPRNPFGDTGTSVSRVEALGTQTSETAAYGIDYRGVLSSSVFLEGRISKLDSRTVFPHGDPNYGTGELLLVYGGYAAKAGRSGNLSYPFGFGISPTPDRRNNRSGNLNLKVFHDLFGSSHELDAGFDYYEGVRGTSVAAGLKGQSFRVGGAYQDASGNYLFPTINVTPNATHTGYLYGQDSTGLRGAAASLDQQLGQDGTTKTQMQAVYLNDQWTINNHWNFMLGLRVEQNKITDTDGSELAKATAFSPRLQWRYDLNGDTKKVFTLTAARYSGDFTAGFTDAFIKKANSRGVYYGWNANPGAAGTAAGVSFYNYAQITNAANYGTVLGYYDSSKNYVLDSGLKTPHMDEVTFGFRRGWDSGSSVKLTYVHRSWKQDWAFQTDYAADQLVTLTDPTGTGQPNQHAIVTHVFNSDDLVREYNGLEMEWSGKINSTWSVGGNWTYARLVGNSNGGDSTTGQSFRDNTPEGYYYQRRYLTQTMGLSNDQFAPTGPLPQDQEQRGRLYISAVLPLGKGTITYSALLRYDTGTKWQGASNTPFVNTLGYGSMPGIPGSGVGAPTSYVNYYGGRGIYSNNDMYSVDFKITFQVPLGVPGFPKLALFGDMTVANAFNHILPTNLDHTLYNGGTGGTTQLYINDPSTFGTTRPNSGINYWNAGRSMGTSIGLRF